VSDPSANASPIFLYDSRFARLARLLALAVITGTAFIGQPHPAWTGNGLVILVTLVVAVGTQLAATMSSTGRGALVRTAIGALSGGILVGYDPTVGTPVLLIFIGIDAGASLDFAPGVAVVSAALVATTLGVLASGQKTSDISLGAVAFIGFLAAAGRKQYMLRAEEAEMHLADAERAREEHARAAALAERTHAAREIHDILAHGLGALVLQLDALEAVLGAEPLDRKRAAELLVRARALAVEGLVEAKQAVGTLRTDAPPVLETLRQLVATTTGGVLEISGNPRPMPPELSVALRRAAQEGLANAGKHAPGAAAAVQLAFATDEIVLTVTDQGCPEGSGPGPLSETGGGYGLEGLRERAELIGGTLVAGPHDTGWRLTLSVPDVHSDPVPGAT
jgi:signal transduction histidine kinase